MSENELNILNDENSSKRLLSKIEIPNSKDPNDCWEWNASKDKNGCGKFYLSCNLDGPRNGKCFRAPRLMYILETKTDIPEGMQVLHSCDNESCCNPLHLRLGTPYDNMQDRKKRGRYNTAPKGEAHHASKLTQKKVKEICKLFYYKNHNLTSIAKKFKVSRVIISDIVYGKSWKSVTCTLIPSNFKTIKQKIKDRNNKIYYLYQLGQDTRNIAKKFKLTVEYTLHVIRKERKRISLNLI